MPTSTRRSTVPTSPSTSTKASAAVPGSRLFVEQKVYDEVVDRLAEKNKDTKVGDPFDPETKQGPQVDQAQFDKILQYVEYGKKDGASCVTGGKRIGDKGYFVEPTLFANVTDDMRIASDEIFGPVLSVLKFKNADEMIKPRERHEFRSGGRGLDARRRQGPSLCQGRSGRHGLGQLLRRVRRGGPVRRLQAKRSRPRARRSRPRMLHGIEDRDRVADLDSRERREFGRNRRLARIRN